MNRRRRPFIPLRKTIFVGCEGACEAGYVALLQDFARDAGLPIHLIVRELGPGAGDPLSRVEMAVRELARHARTRTVIRDRFVLLDSDQAEADRDRAERARRLAAATKIAMVWQEPCFEALLLRHLPGCTTRRPPDTQGAHQALEREWPEYIKPMPRVALARRIDLDAVRRAAGVEAGLRALLRCIALID